MGPEHKVLKHAPRNVNTRSIGLMKKASELSKLGARVYMYIEFENRPLRFQTDKAFSSEIYNGPSYEPNHFRFKADASSTSGTSSPELNLSNFEYEASASGTSSPKSNHSSFEAQAPPPTGTSSPNSMPKQTTPQVISKRPRIILRQSKQSAAAQALRSPSPPLSWFE